MKLLLWVFCSAAFLSHSFAFAEELGKGLHPERLGGMCEVPSNPAAAAPILKLNEELKNITLQESKEEREATFGKLRDKIFDHETKDAWERSGRDRLKEHSELKKFGLSDAEFLALFSYTASHWRPLNKALRDCDSDVLIEERPYIATLNTALSKLPDYKGAVWRGIYIPEEDLDHTSKQFEEGSRVAFPAFTSTSAAGQMYDLNVSMLIHSKHGKRIDDFSAHEVEYEVLFRSGTQFKVINETKHICGNGRICALKIELEELDD
jgi:hypothetical protein